jgi:ABC-type sugar transport system ATPase subunit
MRVSLVEHLGNEQIVHVELPNVEDLPGRVAQGDSGSLRVVLPHDRQVLVGETLPVVLDFDCAHRFDALSGDRIVQGDGSKATGSVTGDR